jgi:ribonucleoside-triphosphate reductase
MQGRKRKRADDKDYGAGKRAEGSNVSRFKNITLKRRGINPLANKKEMNMRNLEAIENDLTAAREALSSVKGTPAEVYSRIVGYYRSVRNWNLGKREEYGERKLYRVNDRNESSRPGTEKLSVENYETALFTVANGLRLLLFVRSSCPGCPPAKAAAGRLGIPVDLVNADSPEGIAEAVRRNVMSTPTALLLSSGGEELGRAGDADAISRFPVAAAAEVDEASLRALEAGIPAATQLENQLENQMEFQLAV